MSKPRKFQAPEEVYKDNIRTIVAIGEKTYIMYYTATIDYQISLSGSLTNYNFEVPFAFRIEYIIICADDATSKEIDVYILPMIATQLAYPPRLLSKTGDTITDRFVQYGRQYKFPRGIIRFALDGTANKKIFVLVGLQRLGK